MAASGPGRALVVGLGLSGRAAAALLARRGWSVTAVDAGPAEGAAAVLEPLGVEVRTGHAGAVPGVDLVVKSPGVPGEDEAIAAARAGGVPVWSEIELAGRESPNPVLAITGTNGKTTTTELTAHLLRSAGRAAVACGNVGTPVAGLVDAVDPAAWLVMECSSFQLEDIERFHPAGAVLLNLSPDHMDRHGSMDAYRRAKLRIFERQEPGDLAILPAPLLATGRAASRRLAEHAGEPDAAAWSEGGLHVARLGWIIDWADVPLRGRHNRENAMAAAALAAHAGLTGAEIAAGLRSFTPVAHRLEPVGERGGVAYVNDSKATNPDAVLAALDAYPAGVRLIAGGRDKGTPFEALARAAAGAVTHAYLMGEAGPTLAAAFAEAGVAHSVLPTMADALAAAAAHARPGETVLLSPACTSFDQFGSYGERGEAFRALVAELPAS
ncbi:MAG: UDP-N-acetylmuramoyl-L-alanine--D-glutamate ligase [Miltoncostaeaceae bacterium]